MSKGRPGLFTDIGKKAKDLLSKDYISDHKISVSTYSQTGVAFTSTAVKKGGLSAAHVAALYKYKNTLIDVKVDTRSNIATTLTFTDIVPSTSRALCTATETRTQKLERIADDLLSLNKLEKHDYAILLRHKMGLHRYGPAISGLGSSSGPSGSGPGAAADAKPAEKLVFDVKLEKFDTAGKIKVIKEIRGFTELGLKEAKDLVEKAPVVVKKGVTKEEAEAIMEKLKAVGATVVME